MTYEIGVAGGGVPAIEQLALADFIARGELDRHVRRMRLRYRQRRDALVSALGRRLADAQVIGIPAGLYALVLLGSGLAEEAVLSAAASRGVGLEGLAWHRADPDGTSGGDPGGPRGLRRGRADGAGGSRRPGLVIGYGNSSEPAIEQGAQRLAEAVAAVAAGVVE